MKTYEIIIRTPLVFTLTSVACVEFHAGSAIYHAVAAAVGHRSFVPDPFDLADLEAHYPLTEGTIVEIPGAFVVRREALTMADAISRIAGVWPLYDLLAKAGGRMEISVAELPEAVMPITEADRIATTNLQAAE